VLPGILTLLHLIFLSTKVLSVTLMMHGTQVELRERECSHVAALPVYQLIANILNFKRSAATIELNSRVGSSFRLLHRFGLDPADFVDVTVLSQAEKRQLMVNAMGSSVQLLESEELDEQQLLLLLVLDAWSRAETVSRIHVYAILLCRSESEHFLNTC
jgi:hypothetical protein